MFEECSLLLLLENKNKNDSLIINRAELDYKTQKVICDTFSKATLELTDGKQKVKFNGIPLHEEDEYLIIENYEISAKIKESIRYQFEVDQYIPNGKSILPIKAAFVGYYDKDIDKYNISFQRFRKEQYIYKNGINIFYDKNTFVQEKRYGLAIFSKVDCIYSGSDLIFDSYSIAKQIFDLSKYYREATDADISNFVGHNNINTNNITLFNSQLDSVIRRKIASIMDSGILDKCSANEIKNKAKSVGLDLIVRNKQLYLPNEKSALKTMLKFLDEEIYKGPFSEDLFQAHYKRRVEI